MPGWARYPALIGCKAWFGAGQVSRSETSPVFKLYLPPVRMREIKYLNSNLRGAIWERVYAFRDCPRSGIVPNLLHLIRLMTLIKQQSKKQWTYGSAYITSPASWAMHACACGRPTNDYAACVYYTQCENQCHTSVHITCDCIHYCSDLGQNVNQSLIPQNKTHFSSSGYSEWVPGCLRLKQK